MAAILRAIFCMALVLASGSSGIAQTQQQRLKAARRALDSLAKTQNPRGYWSAAKRWNRIRRTALSGYAIACEGTTLVQGRYARNLRKAMNYVSGSSKRRSGLFSYSRDPDPMHGHGVAMLFIATLIGEAEDPDRLKELQRQLEKAVRFSAATQLANGGWAEDTKDKQPEAARAYVTATQLLGLFACRRAGIAVPQETLDNGLRFLLHRQQKDGGIAERPGEKQPSHPASSTATLLCLLKEQAGPKPTRSDRKTKQRRVLLLAGGPSRDYRCVSRMLHADARFRVDAWLQTVDPKAGKQIVQPVDTLLTAFPKAADLSKYKAVIAFDPDWRKFKPADVAALDEWVRKRGGGLVLRPGDIFAWGLVDGKMKTITRLYPGKINKDYLFDYLSKLLTPARLQWLDVKAAPVGIPGIMLIKHFRPFHGFYIDKAQDGVSVIARFTEAGTPASHSHILFSSHTAGKGRVFFCGTSETWRLRGTGDRHFEQFWYGVLRHVIPSFSGDLPKRQTSLRIDTTTPRGKVTARLQVYCDRVFAPKSQARMEHRSLAELHYAQAALLRPDPTRNKAVKAVVKRLLDRQTADGSWKSQSNDPLRQAANAAILLLSERVLPFHDR